MDTARTELNRPAGSWRLTAKFRRPCHSNYVSTGGNGARASQLKPATYGFPTPPIIFFIIPALKACMLSYPV